MKKLLKKIKKFFNDKFYKSRLHKPMSEDFKSYERRKKRNQEYEATSWKQMPDDKPFYAVYDNRTDEFLTHEKNLNQVSHWYPTLKKSTLYDAFADENNSSRTYTKYNYKVIECQKS